jgi:predicted nuclease of restriction endonuclease-like (RecB) superfamily
VKQSLEKSHTPGRNATAASGRVPRDYRAFLDDLKSRIRSAQMRAALAVNRELIQLYWDIGRSIAEKQDAVGWGKSVVERLASDLHREFPAVSGFSASNIWRMRAFFRAYADRSPILAQPVRELATPKKLAQAVRELDKPFVPQPVRQLRSAPAAPPQPLPEIPWGHNVVLVEMLKDLAERLWYAQQIIAHGWSRNVLVHWIESDLYSRQGKAITNFSSALPPAQSDLAQQILKDPYNFDFLTLHAEAMERELEEGLLEHITRFLLELGAGFAFVGRQVRMEVDGEDFWIDLVFYHLRLRCFFVIDLKAGNFKPEYAGKMNFYLSAVDDRLRHADDGPSIGLILCKTRSKVIAEYALRHLQRPVGVARYITKLTEKLPSELAGKLPSIKEIEAELAKRSRRGRAGSNHTAKSSRLKPQSRAR